MGNEKAECIGVVIGLVVFVVVFTVFFEEIFLPKATIEISNSGNLQYEVDSTGNNITWTLDEINVDSAYYQITLNGNSVDSGSWYDEETVNINVDGLSIGSHIYTLSASGGRADPKTNNIEVTVTPFIERIEISTSGNFQYENGTVGNNISWTIFGKGVESGSYQITNDSALVESGNWNNETIVELNVDGLPIGFYNYTLKATGGLADPQEKIIVVNVTLFIKRIEISTSGSLQYENGTVGNIISWTILGKGVESGSYQINSNSTLVESGNWNNETIVELNVDGLPIGSYNYTLTATGGTVDPQEKTIEVIVTPPIERIEVSTSGNLHYEKGSTGHNISWTINGKNLDSGFYKIRLNGNIVDTGNWNNKTTVTLNVDGLSLGLHNYTLRATGGTADPQEKNIEVTVMTQEEYEDYINPVIAGYDWQIMGSISILCLLAIHKRLTRYSNQLKL